MNIVYIKKPRIPHKITRAIKKKYPELFIENKKMYDINRYYSFKMHELLL
jgi:hypothetical protein